MTNEKSLTAIPDTDLEPDELTDAELEATIGGKDPNDRDRGRRGRGDTGYRNMGRLFSRYGRQP